MLTFAYYFILENNISSFFKDGGFRTLLQILRMYIDNYSIVRATLATLAVCSKSGDLQSPVPSIALSPCSRCHHYQQLFLMRVQVCVYSIFY